MATQLKPYLKGLRKVIGKKLGMPAYQEINAQDYEAQIDRIPTIADDSIPKYKGPFMVTPTDHPQTIQLEGKYVEANVTVDAAPPYTPLEFIYMKNTYIDSGFKANPKTTKVYMDFKIIKGIGGLLGSQEQFPPSNLATDILILTDDTFRIDWIGSREIINYQLNTRYYIECFNNEVNFNGTKYNNGITKTNQYSKLNMFIGGINKEENPIINSDLYCYGCKIWDNGKLIRNYIPCNYLGNTGMWDKVENKFYPALPIKKTLELKEITLKQGLNILPKNTRILSFKGKPDTGQYFSIIINGKEYYFEDTSSKQITLSPALTDIFSNKILIRNSSNNTYEIDITNKFEINLETSTQKDVIIYVIEI